MIESKLTELIKEIRGERPDNVTLFEELLFYVKDSKDNGAVITLRFDNGFGALVFLGGGEALREISDDTIYTVTWLETANHISEYNVTHLPLGGPTNVKYTSYEELRNILRRIRDYPNEPAPF
jgi:hypothetical protein